MTYCLGIRTNQGLVGISDTRLVSGNETTTAKKVIVHQSKKQSFFIMTSGLRSVRDKTLTYFLDDFHENDIGFDKLYKIVNALAERLRKVEKEDKCSLIESGLKFNLFAIIGGQCANDQEHKMYLLYPEGNWVEVGKASPFFIIGNTGYGKPILDRTIRLDSTIKFALKTGFLSFDATRLSSNDVDYPIDVVIMNKGNYSLIEHRFEKEDLQKISDYWNLGLTESINRLPEDWMEGILGKL